MNREPKLLRTAEIALSDLTISDRLRPVTEAGVAQVVASVEQIGHITDAIQVREVRHKGKALILMAGAHRVAAAEALGHETIRANIWDCNDDQSRLFEIDDNLASRELTALERAVFMAERKRVYLRMYPETAAGVAGGKARQNSAIGIMPFAESTAEQFGKSRTWAERYTKIGEALIDQKDDLAGSPISRSFTDLAALAKAAPEKRAKLIDVIASTAPPTLRDAESRAGFSKQTPPDEEKKMRAMQTAWTRLSVRQKKAWIASLQDDEEVRLVSHDGRVLVDFLDFKIDLAEAATP